MRLKSKRLISLLLAGSMMVSMVPAGAVTAFAAETKNIAVMAADSDVAEPVSLSVTVNAGESLETAVKNAAQSENKNWENITNLTVTTAEGKELDKADFQFLSGVVVTEPGNGQKYAFQYAGADNYTGGEIVWLSNLQELDLSDASCENNEIPPHAFRKNTKITKIILPNNLVRTRIHAFSSMTNLTYLGTTAGNLKFPETMQILGAGTMFNDANLKGTLEIPSAITAIGASCFEGSGVGNNGNVFVRNGIQFVENVDAEDGMSGSRGATFKRTQNIRSITLDEGITIIPKYFAANSQVASVLIPSTVTTIENNAFYTMKALSGTFVIPEKVTTIGEAAFAYDDALDNVIVESPTVAFGNYVFNSCKNGLKIYFVSTTATQTNTSKLPKSVMIILNTDGGKVTPNSEVKNGLYTPARDGYKFVGWYTDVNDEATKLTTAAVAGKTYTAHWAELHTVTFNDGVDSTTDSTVQVAHGETVAQPTDPKKDGCKFDGWYKDAAGTQAFNFATDTITDNTIVYAKWTPYETKVEPKVEANADPASKTVEITVNVEAAPAELDGATATLNFTDANDNDDSDNVVEVKVNGKTVNQNADGKYTASLNDLMNTEKISNASESGADAVMLADVSEDAVVPSTTVNGTALLTVTYKTPGKHNVGIVLNAANGDVICKEIATVEIAPEPGTLNLTACTATLEDGTPVENGAKVPVGAEVTVTFEPDADSDLVLNGWKVTPETLTDTNDKLVKDITADTFTFVMPETDKGVTIEAQTKAKAAAAAEDDSMDAAAVVTGVVLGTGTAILAYHIGTEVYAEQVLGKGVAIPRTREEVALKAWELAGKPAVELNGEPLSEAAQAEKWAVESGLMQNVDGSFNGSKKMSKLKALRTLDAAKKLG